MSGPRTRRVWGAPLTLRGAPYSVRSMARDRIVMVRMTDGEYARLRAEAERRGLPLGTFLRTVALAALPEEKPKPKRK